MTNVGKPHFFVQAKLLGVPSELITKYASQKGFEWRSIGSSSKQLKIVETAIEKADNSEKWCRPTTRKLGLDSQFKTYLSVCGLYVLTVEKFKSINTHANRAMITIKANL